MQDTLAIILVLLISAVLAVALFRALRLPTMLAYFLVGLALGPETFGILPDTESSRALAEFGVVFLMFSIGLEFSLPQLYAMRRTVLGLGGAQVLVTMTAIMGVCWLAGLGWAAAFVIAAALAMSSTAIVSKMLAERVDLNSRHGRLSIGILLFQDIAVVPVLVLIPALAAHSGSLTNTLGWAFLKAAIVLLVLFIFGKQLINPWFGLVARQRSRELFVMNVLMVTLVLAYLTHLAGLSYALGAFIAGMLISETRYRYQVESDIASFRDILLGLFFISIGMLLDISVLVANIGFILLLLVALVLFKAAVIGALSRAFGHELGVAIRTGVILAQAGEFGFVILALGLQQGLMNGQALQIVLAASVLSMIAAPFIIQYNGKLARRLVKSYNRNQEQKVSEIEEIGKQMKDHVIICGFGRSGQYLARFLKEENIPFIALDIDPSRVQEAAVAGENVMYGDAGRRVVLAAAGGARAKALIVSYADAPSSMKILHVVQENYPHLPVIVRTVDDSNMEAFREAGAAEVVPEVLEGSLMLASHALMLMGVPLNRVVKRIRLFREERYKLFKGFFRGITDAEDEAMEKHQPRLHSVPITASAYAVGKRFVDLELQDHNVEVQSIRRPNLKSLEPTLDTVFEEGDVVVLLGEPQYLVSAEKVLLKGR
ncbi:MAG: potassium transporter [Betaproteobacteria bacterium HGW-Betaproteobacteria-8]|nr:MAG: potassium transporter [Betaproteobacteria bacterium HGW-Betaproteobacteria-8]